MVRFLESAVPVYIMSIVTAAGVIMTWIAGIYYRQMIKQTENMMSVRQPFLLQMKNRFENTYRVNKGIEDIPLFVERQVSGCRIFFMRAQSMARASKNASVCCILLGGVICVLQQRELFTVREIAASGTLTLLFAAIGWGAYILVAPDRQFQYLQLQLAEYFTNTMSKRIGKVRDDEKILASETEEKERRHKGADAFFAEKNESDEDVQGTSPEKEHFTEEDLVYLRQSLERIAAGRENRSGSTKKHSFSAKDEKAIEDILKEYFM